MTHRVLMRHHGSLALLPTGAKVQLIILAYFLSIGECHSWVPKGWVQTSLCERSELLESIVLHLLLGLDLHVLGDSVLALLSSQGMALVQGSEGLLNAFPLSWLRPSALLLLSDIFRWTLFLQLLRLVEVNLAGVDFIILLARVARKHLHWEAHTLDVFILATLFLLFALIQEAHDPLLFSDIMRIAHFEGSFHLRVLSERRLIVVGKGLLLTLDA